MNRLDQENAIGAKVPCGRATRLRLALVCSVAVATGCEVPVDDQLWRCTSSSDCGSGWQCDPNARHCVEAYNGRNGVFDDRLVVGMTAYLSEDIPSLAVISAQGVAGIQAYFQHVNSAGGIHGRRLELRVRDDRFDPTQTTQQFEELVGAADNAQREVFLMCNTLGDPTSLAAAQIAVREKILLWAPGSGLSSLETDPPSRYLFNYRPRYADESEQLTQYLLEQTEPATPSSNIALIAQGIDFEGTLDADGVDVLDGVSRALNVARADVPTSTFVLGSTEIGQPALRTLKWMASPDRVESGGRRYVGLVVAMVWDAGSAFIKTVQDQLSLARRNQPLQPQFQAEFSPEEVVRLGTIELRMVAYSAIATDALRAALLSSGTYPWPDGNGQTEQRAYGAGLVISQVVPLASSDASAAIRFREHLAAYNSRAIPGEFSLESYLNMWLLGEALQAHGRDLTTETFIQTLESFSTDLGVGTMLGFSIDSHLATDRVWGLRLDDQLNSEWLGLLLEP